MRIDSTAHRWLTLSLFAFVLGGIFAINFYATDGGWAGVLRAVVPVIGTLLIVMLVGRISKGMRRARG